MLSRITPPHPPQADTTLIPHFEIAFQTNLNFYNSRVLIQIECLADYIYVECSNIFIRKTFFLSAKRIIINRNAKRSRLFTSMMGLEYLFVYSFVNGWKLNGWEELRRTYGWFNIYTVPFIWKREMHFFHDFIALWIRHRTNSALMGT